MPLTDDRPTIGERYLAATTSGDLRVVDDRIGDAERLMAAASQRHRLGALLLRLQAEYDVVRSELERAGAISRAHEASARVFEVVAPEKSAEIRRRSAAEVLTARALILSELRTLREAKAAVGAAAIVLATRERFMRPGDVVMRIAGRVLDVHLDPTCHTCDGTGYVSSGYSGGAQALCRHCGGTCHRRDRIGADGRAQWFAFQLLGRLSDATNQACGAMAALLRR